jgi:hypothetical protein
MTDLQEIKLPPQTFSIYMIGSFVISFFVVLTSGIPLEDIHTILNTYIIIEIAIVSVAFVAMSIKQDEKRKETYAHLFLLVLFSSIILIFAVGAYFYSFNKSTSYFATSLTLAGMTWFVFISLYGMFSAFLEFNPDYVETKDEG